jgi:glycosyltransferase involved in cell wall biosynthesis
MAETSINLFVDAHCFDKEYQGSRTFMKEVYAVMTKKKDIQFFFAAFHLEELKKVFPPAENIVLLQYKSRSAFFRLVYEIPMLIRKHKIDIAHFQYFTPLLKNCRQLVTIHDVLFCDFPKEFSFIYRITRRFLFKRSAKCADLLTTVSSFSQQAIHKHLFIPVHKIHVIPNGVSNRFFEPSDKQQSKQFVKEKFGIRKYLLYVSRIEPRKNHLLLLKAFVELKLHQKGYHLVFIGHTSIPVPSLQAFLCSLPSEIRDFVFICGQVNDADLLQLYRAADVFVYPSKAEGFGIPPLEAGAARVPVICSNTTSMEAFSFFAPFHINPLSYATLKDNIEKAIVLQHNEFVLNAKADNIRINYSWETAAEKLYQLIKGKENGDETPLKRTEDLNIKYQQAVQKAI